MKELLKVLAIGLILLWVTGCSLETKLVQQDFPGEIITKDLEEIAVKPGPYNGVSENGILPEIENYDEIIAKKSMENMSKAYATYKTLGVPWKAQETSYWCGPASIQMIQYYFNMPASQSYIASRCGTSPDYGTYVYRIVEWLNASPMTGYADLPSWWEWVYYSLPDYETFKLNLQKSVSNYDAPQIWHLKTYPSSTYHLPGWTYNAGHYVTGSGYDFTGSTYYVLYDDPWYGTGGGSNKWAAAYTAYRCIIANARYIIW